MSDMDSIRGLLETVWLFQHAGHWVLVYFGMWLIISLQRDFIEENKKKSHQFIIFFFYLCFSLCWPPVLVFGSSKTGHG